MSNTRLTLIAPPDGPPAAAGMSNPKISGLNAPMNVVVAVNEARSEKEAEASIWLTNYTYWNGLTAATISETLGMDRKDIRAALTDPDADASSFARAVSDLRADFDGSRRRLFKSHAYLYVRKACGFALDRRKMVDVIGKWRTGKSWIAWEFFLDHMHCAVWCLVPEGNDLESLVKERARMMSIGVGTALTPAQIKPKIRSCIGRRGIRLFFYDEGHRLWPNIDRAGRMAKPVRMEHMRNDWDAFIPSQIGIVNLTTPQHAEMLAKAVSQHEKWAPGQLMGRSDPWVLPDATSDEDIAGIARWHGGTRLTDAAVPLLVDFCKTSEGYLGSMINVIERTEYVHGKLTEGTVASTIKELRAHFQAVNAQLEAEKARARKYSPRRLK